jgi:H+/Cl- antiporter ClcA
LIWLLPVGGAVWGVVLDRYGQHAQHGAKLTRAQIFHFSIGVPTRVAPLALAGTLLTHLLGGSAGREGTALQMASGLGDGAARRLRFDNHDRRVLLIAALAGGFGSVFGVPFAGTLFAIEIAPASWRIRAQALVPAVLASFAGDWLVGALGVHHSHYAPLNGLTARDLGLIALYAPAFGLCGFAFVQLTELLRGLYRRVSHRRPVRMGFGGALIAAIVLTFHLDRFSGLSLDMLAEAFHGPAPAQEFEIKALLTALTVAAGFAGGEVTPLFVIGATLGSALSQLGDGPLRAAAAVGMVATFGAAAQAPLACMVMGIELFGWGAAPAMLIGCSIARVCGGRGGLYDHSALTLTVTGDR